MSSAVQARSVPVPSIAEKSANGNREALLSETAPDISFEEAASLLSGTAQPANDSTDSALICKKVFRVIFLANCFIFHSSFSAKSLWRISTCCPQRASKLQFYNAQSHRERPQGLALRKMNSFDARSYAYLPRRVPAIPI